MHFLPFRLRVVPRTLRFKQPAGTSRGVYTERRVWYVVVSSADPQIRFTGLGECAPLPDLSCDYSPAYEAELRRVCAAVEAAQELDAERLRHRPSMLLGLQMAFRSAAGSLQGDYRLLYPSAFTRGERPLRINGLVWMGRYEEMLERMEEKLAAGFHCVKLKIGAIDFEEELALIRRLRERFDARRVELRVDANGGFTPEDAPRVLQRLAEFDIHSIEQPIRQGQWDEMARLCAATPLPIALDEELIGVNDPGEKVRLLDTVRPQYIILKPSLHGAFTGAAEWMQLARERGIGYWTTSALESNVGLNAIAQWCAAADPGSPLPQGLGTGQLFVENYEGAPLSLEGEELWYGTPPQRNYRAELRQFHERWISPSPTLEVHTSGSTGAPRPIEVSKIHMWASAEATLQALSLQPGNTALLAMPLRYIAAQMMVVRAMAGGLQLLPVVPSLHPYARLHEAPDFAALTPAQVYESLRVPHEHSLLRRTLCLIIGGGAISPELEAELARFPNPVWSTYGMTETLSHIALRRLNGPDASPFYRPLPGVEVSLSPEGTLQIDAPAICDERVVTNDLAELTPEGFFRIRGRRDNVICTGGLKLQTETLEAQLEGLPFAFQLTHVPDARWGEAVTLLYEAEADCTQRIADFCRERLDRHARPRHILRVDRLPLTETGKPARRAAQALAEKMLRGE